MTEDKFNPNCIYCKSLPVCVVYKTLNNIIRDEQGITEMYHHIALHCTVWQKR